MIIKTIKLLENSDASLDIFIPDVSAEINPEVKYDAIVVCPGGGYGFVSDREAEPVALAYVGKGYAAFVLTYSIAPAFRYPQALLELSKAMSLIRENAAEWHINPDHIAVIGFSAGGHLAASLAAFWQRDSIKEKLSIPFGANRPNAVILSYAVVTSNPDEWHEGSYQNLLGENFSSETCYEQSPDKHITKNAPPAFLWHTFDDNCVPVENALRMAIAYKKADIPFELHVFPEGVHGLSLCDKRSDAKGYQAIQNPYVAKWFDLSVSWLKEYAFK